jgi:hypothetical protein
MSVYTDHSMRVTLICALQNHILTKAIPCNRMRTHIRIGTVRQLLFIQHPGSGRFIEPLWRKLFKFNTHLSSGNTSKMGVNFSLDGLRRKNALSKVLIVDLHLYADELLQNPYLY